MKHSKHLTPLKHGLELGLQGPQLQGRRWTGAGCGKETILEPHLELGLGLGLQGPQLELECHLELELVALPGLLLQVRLSCRSGLGRLWGPKLKLGLHAEQDPELDVQVPQLTPELELQ